MRHQDKHEDEELLQVTKGFILVVQAVDTPSVFEPESAMSTSEKPSRSPVRIQREMSAMVFIQGDISIPSDEVLVRDFRRTPATGGSR
ncbi:hypothetical protein PABG_04844 [Paracoccidioides brasiliensis Pb03]|nr:hypothetical protein PABG_04844 [Paracoccidioides brasiliensis Pb03]